MDTASTSDAVTFITYVQSLKRKIKQFEKQVEVSSLVRFPPAALQAVLLQDSPQRPSQLEPPDVLVKYRHWHPGNLHFEKLDVLKTSRFEKYFLSFKVF